MSNLFKYAKRLLTALLATTLIMTSVPYDILAETLTETPAETVDESYVEEPVVTEESVPVEDELASKPVGEEYEEPSEDGLADNTPKVFFPTDFEPRNINGVIYTDTNWYIYDSVTTSFSFELSPPAHYSVGKVTAKMGETSLSVTNNGGTYTVTNSGNTFDADVVISAEKEDITHTVTFTDNTEGNATITPGDGMTQSGNAYTVTEADGYSFTVSNVAANYKPIVTIEGNATPKSPESESAGVYTYSITEPEGDQNLIVELLDENQYKLNFNASNLDIYFSKNSNPTESDFVKLTSENNEFYKDEAIIWYVMPHEGYRLEADSVKINNNKPTASGDYYTYTFGSGDAEVTATTVAQCVVTLTDTNKALNTLTAIELTGSGEPAGTINAVKFVEGTARLSIDKGNKIQFSGITFPESNTFSLLKSVKVGSVELTADSEKKYTTNVLNSVTSTVTFTTASLKADDVKLTNGVGTDKDITDFRITEGTTTSGEVKYVLREGGIVFTPSPKSGKAVRSVSYNIGTKANAKTAKTAVKTGKNTFKIPEADVQAGILAGGLTLTAVLGEEKVTATVTKDSNGATLKYREYSILDGAYTSAGEEKSVDFGEGTTAEISVNNGNVFALTVTPSGSNLVISDSVTFDGKAVAAEASGDLSGKYIIAPVESTNAGVNALTVSTYAPVEVKKTDAEGEIREGEGSIPLTKITIDDSCLNAGKTKDAAIEFERDYANDDRSAFDVTFESPVAYYGDEANETSLEVEAVGNTGKSFRIKQSEVEKAIKAGKTIVIQAKDTPISIKKLTLNILKTKTDLDEPRIKKVGIYAYTDSNKEILVCSDTGVDKDKEFLFQEGNYLVVEGIRGLGETEEVDETYLPVATSFIKVDDGVNEFYGRKTNEYKLGRKNDDVTLTLSSTEMRVDAITVKGDPEDDEKYEVKWDIESDNKVNVTVDEAVKIQLNVEPSSAQKEKSYKLDPMGVTYKIAGDKEQQQPIALKMSNDKNYCAFPLEVMAKAAFAGGIEINAKVLDAGYQKQTVTLMQDYEHTVYTAEVDGASVNYSGGWKIPYDKDVDVTLSPDFGYKINEVFYAPAMITDTLSGDVHDWLTKLNNRYVERFVPDEDGNVKFTIPKVEEPINVYVYAVDNGEYTLAFGTSESASEFFDPNTEVTRDVNYNELYQLVLYKGASKRNDIACITDYTTWTLGAFCGTEDVDDLVLPGMETGNCRSVHFDKTPGKTVKITVESTAKKDDGTTPKYKWTLYLTVSKAITTEDISFKNKNPEFQLCQKNGKVELKVKEGFDTNRVKIVATGDNAGLLEINPDLKNKVIYVSTGMASHQHINKTTKLNIVDALDNTIIDTANVTIKNDAVTDISKENLGEFTADATNDTISLNFAKIPFGGEGYDKSLDNLYYLVNVEGTNVPTDAGVKQKVENILVPATEAGYEVNLAKDDKSYETKEYTYKVKVQLVQTTPKADGTYDDTLASNTALSTAFAEKDVTTKPSGPFATKLVFIKNNDKNFSKIFSTMGDVVLGTVSFPDIDSKTPVAVKRLEKVEVTDKSGNVIFNTKDHPDVIKVRTDDNAIIFNPHNAEVALNTTPGSDVRIAGSYSVVAYAVEPKGVDVSVKAPLKIEQGIKGLTVSAPQRVYKAPGKAVSIKATVSYMPDHNPLPTKKVEWSLAKDAAGKEPFVLDGITMKNGTVNIKNTVAIPVDGLTFYICATAADYPAHSGMISATPVQIHSQAQAPKFITIGDTMLIGGKSYITGELIGDLHAYDENNQEIEATFKVSGIQYNELTGAYADKIVKKASVTATSSDGSKFSTKVEFSVVSDQYLAPKLYGNGGYENDILTFLEETETEYRYTATNNYPAGRVMSLIVSGKNGGVIDHTLKTDGGVKKVKSWNANYGTFYTLDAVKPIGTVTIVDNSNGKKETKITINNTLITASKTAAPKITATNMYDTGYDAKKGVIKKDNKGNIFNFMDYKDLGTYQLAGNYNKVTYKLMNGKSLLTGKVLISTDDFYLDRIFKENEKYKYDDLTQYLYDTGRSKEYTTTLKNGEFTIEYIYEDGKLNIPAGNYSFTVTPIDDKGVATAKSATFKFKAAAAPKAKVSPVTTSFKNFKDTADFGGFKVQNIVFSKVYDEEVSTAKFTGNLRGINTKGKISRFATVFSTTAELKVGWLTCVKKPEQEDYDGGDVNKGMTGYVEFSWTNLDGTTGTALTKISVKPKKGQPFEPVNGN